MSTNKNHPTANFVGFKSFEIQIELVASRAHKTSRHEKIASTKSTQQKKISWYLERFGLDAGNP
jgi:hypothetical protein